MLNMSRRYMTAVDDLPILILREFDTQPGLRLTFAQVRRLWDLSEAECRDVLAYLVGQRLLRCDADGQICLLARGASR